MLTTKDIKPILESMYECRSEMVPCFIGAPGIGKTQGLYQFAQEKGVKVVTFILSNTVPSEVSGIRMPDTETKKLEVFDDSRMASLEDGDILFFDEILEAPPMLWSAVLTLVQDRVLASGRMLPDVMIVAASNKVASPGIIAPSVRDRFMWCEIVFDVDNWLEWFQSTYHYTIPARVKRYIQSDSAEYNILTPRKFTKLFEYWCDATEQDKALRERAIMSMFANGTEVLKLLHDCKPVTKTHKEFVAEELDLMGIELPEDWSTMSLNEIFKWISQLDEVDKIQEALSKIEV